MVPSWGSVTDSDNELFSFFFFFNEIKGGYSCKPHSRASCWMTRRFFFFSSPSLFFACERLVVNPPALTGDCPRLRVNEVRMESSLAPDRQKKKKSLDPEDQWLCLIPWTNTNNMIQKREGWGGKERTKQKHNLFDEIKSESERHLHCARAVRAFIFPLIPFSGPMRQICNWH